MHIIGMGVLKRPSYICIPFTCMLVLPHHRIYSDQPRWRPAYRLVVSEGRIVNVFPITSSGDSDSGLQFHLEKPESDDGISFSGLKSLVEHYKCVHMMVTSQ